MEFEKKRSNSIFFRVVTVFVVCMLPLIIVQTSMYLWGTNAVREELFDSASVNAIFLRDQFDDSVSAITIQIQYILKAEDVSEFFVYYQTYKAADIYMQARSTLNVLNIVRASNPLIEEIRLYYPRLGVGLISGQHSGLMQYDGAEINARMDASRASKSPMIQHEDEFFISALSPVSVSDSESVPAYYIEVILDNDEILSNLSAFNTSKKRYSLQYNHANGRYLFSDEHVMSAESLAQLDEAMLSIPTEKEQSLLLSLNDGKYTLVASYSQYLNMTYGQLLSQVDLERIPNMFLKFMLGFGLLGMISLLVLCLSIRRHVSRPTHKLLDAFAATGEGCFDTRIRDGYYAWEYQALIERFNDMNEQIQQLITTNYEHTINLQRAQLKQLQAQINPHFLYNSFFLLRHMVRSGERSTCMDFLGCLGNYFRYITDNDNDTASLAEEYEHAKNYLSIQLMRFEDILEAEIQPLPESLANVEVLRLTLQPLFENVMTHSRWNDSSLHRVRLSIEHADGSIFITVEDNGEGVTDEQLEAIAERLNKDAPISETSGLDNIHRRLRLHYGNRGGLTVGRSSLGGFSVMITMPDGGAK